MTPLHQYSLCNHDVGCVNMDSYLSLQVTEVCKLF